MTMLTRAVAESRRSSMKALMEAGEFEALAFLTPAFICFAPNFLLPWTETRERPVAVVLPRQGEPFALFHELSENSWNDAAAAGIVWLSDVTFYGETPGPTQRMPLTPQSSLRSRTVCDRTASMTADRREPPVCTDRRDSPSASRA